MNKKIKSRNVKVVNPTLSPLQVKLLKIRFTTKLRSRIYTKLGKFLENAVPLIRALEIVRMHESDDGKKNTKLVVLILDDIINEIRNGKSFSLALHKWVKDEEVSILNAGEIAGTLHVSIKEILFMFKANKAIKSALGGLIYLVALIVSTIFFLYIFSMRVVPAFVDILPREKWKGQGAMLGNLSDFIMNWYLTIFVVFAVTLILIFISFPHLVGRLRIKLDRLVPWSIYKTVKGCAFLIGFSALSKAGVTAPEVLNILGKFANAWYSERLSAARRKLLNGSPNIGEALYTSGFEFPDKTTIIDMRSYSSLSGADEMLDILSKDALNTTVEKIQAQIGVLKNIAIVIMGFTFMFIISAMFDLQMQISG